jgi:putative protease
MALINFCHQIELPIHASTQTDNRDAQKVEWLHQLGFRRVVLARELSLDEMRKIHAQVPDVELEAFVHGALCVSYSGLCYASQYCLNRSANRGECAQMCRLKYSLVDNNGKVIDRPRHYLSLKDMCRIDYLEEMADAGIVSFKIEGRLKNVDYVKNVVAAYNQKLNELVAKRPDDYQRVSLGKVVYSFQPNLQKTFNRGYTDYFIHGRTSDVFSFDTPKALGEYVGKVKDIREKTLIVAGTATFANGDGLCFFNDEHELEGFRINRVEGNHLYLMKRPRDLRIGKALYRNNDEYFSKILTQKTAERKIPISMSFCQTGQGFILHAQLSEWPQVSVSKELVCETQPANKSQHDNYIRQLTKLGNTPFSCEQVEIPDEVSSCFIPSSLLSELRRNVVDLLRETFMNYWKENNFVETSIQEGAKMHSSSEYQQFSYLYNISNHVACDFYQRQGLSHSSPAFELSDWKDKSASPLLMQCKHCIRYAFGFCVKNGGKIPTWNEPLYLQLPDGQRFRLQFDCQKCQMNVYAS